MRKGRRMHQHCDCILILYLLFLKSFAPCKISGHVNVVPMRHAAWIATMGKAALCHVAWCTHVCTCNRFLCREGPTVSFCRGQSARVATKLREGKEVMVGMK